MDKFQIGTRALILKNGEVLLLKRSKSAPNFSDFWDLPGGPVNHKELPDEVIIKHITEQTGLTVENSALVADASFLREGEPSLALIYIVDYKEGDVKLSDKFDAYKWAEIGKVVDEEMLPWLLDQLRVILEKYSQPQ